MSHHIVKFSPGEMVIQEKTNCDTLYVIKSGQLEVFKTGKGGQKIPLAIVNSGEYLGEGALLTGQNHSASAIALTEVQAINIGHEEMNAQLPQMPKWLSALTRGLVERLNHANELLRRNNIIDEQMMSAIQAIEVNNKKEEEEEEK